MIAPLSDRICVNISSRGILAALLEGLHCNACVGLKEPFREALVGMLYGEEGLLRCPRPR